MEVNVFDDVPDGPSETGLSRLSKLLRRRQQAEMEVERLTVELKSAQEAMRHIDEVEFPELFLEVGVDSFTANNRVVTLKQKLYGGIPKNEEGRAKAMEYLKANGGEAILRMDVSLSFAKGEGQMAKGIAKELQEKGFNPVVKESVHASTYHKWIREQLEAGNPVPLSDLGVHNRKYVEIT